MSKLLVNGEWYERVLPAAIYEVDFEQLILTEAAHLYPAFHLVRFKKQVRSEDGVAIADLALIDKDYRSWWVVEVELGAHSFSHVDSQVAILANASYGADEAEYLASRNTHLDRGLVRQMMMGFPPSVLVLVNEAKPEWTRSLRRWDASVGIVEVFRSQRNQDILRVNGDQPQAVVSDIVSACQIDDVLQTSLVVASPAGLSIRPGEQTRILYDGGLTSWRRVDVATKVWLMPIGRCPIPVGQKRFVLERNPDAQLSLRALLRREKT